MKPAKGEVSTCSQMLLLGVGLLAVAGCTGLDTSRAQRCFTHSDCNAARACVEGLCQPIVAEPDGRLTDSAVAPGPAAPMDAASMDGAPPRDHPIPDEVPDEAGASSEAHDAGPIGDASASLDGSDDEASTRRDDDAGSEGDEDASAEPDELCSPAEIGEGHVALWLDAAYGVTTDTQGHVQRWSDRSSHGHTAEPSGDALDWPLLATDSSGPPAVQFGHGATPGRVRRLRVADHASLRFGSGDYALLVALRYRNHTLTLPDEDVGVVYMKVCNCEGYPGAALTANDNWGGILDGSPTRSSFAFQNAGHAAYVARSAVQGFNDDEVHVVVAKRLGGVLSVSVDGLPHAVALLPSANDISNAGTDVTIGANAYYENQALDGEIFELVVLAGAAARDVTIDRVARCLMRKHGPP
jgi:hypothetical protein